MNFANFLHSGTWTLIVEKNDEFVKGNNFKVTGWTLFMYGV